MTKHKWRPGPPPEIGWWPASKTRDPRAIRWGNGRWWSRHAVPEESADQAAQWARLRSGVSLFVIGWTDRWWL